MTAERISPSADLLVAWLRDRLKVDVDRARAPAGPGITEVVLETREGPIRISRPDGRLATYTSPGQPDRPVALKRRATLPELLAEELRRLDEDDVYAAAARTLTKMHAAERRDRRGSRSHESADALATAVAGRAAAGWSTRRRPARCRRSG